MKSYNEFVQELLLTEHYKTQLAIHPSDYHAQKVWALLECEAAELYDTQEAPTEAPAKKKGPEFQFLEVIETLENGNVIVKSEGRPGFKIKHPESMVESLKSDLNIEAAGYEGLYGKHQHEFVVESAVETSPEDAEDVVEVVEPDDTTETSADAPVRSGNRKGDLGVWVGESFLVLDKEYQERDTDMKPASFVPFWQHSDLPFSPETVQEAVFEDSGILADFDNGRITFTDHDAAEKFYNLYVDDVFHPEWGFPKKDRVEEAMRVARRKRIKSGRGPLKPMTDDELDSSLKKLSTLGETLNNAQRMENTQ